MMKLKWALVVSLFIACMSTGHAGTIAGTVTDADGITPLEGIEVEVYRWTDDEWGGWWNSVKGTTSSSSGEYTLTDLAEDTYRVRFRDPSGNYLTQVYQGFNVNWPDDGGMDIFVPQGDTVPNINASLTVASRITGTVTGPDGITPLEGIEVEVYRWNGSWWNWASWTETDASGIYQLGGLAQGTYRVSFWDWSGEYVSEVYDGVFVSWPGAGGTDIFVPQGDTVSNINASLTMASKISGWVTASDGVTPLEDIEVRVSRWAGSWWETIAWSWTDGDGYYEAGGLVDGTYRVGFFDEWYDLYANEYYDDAPSLDSATDVYIPPESVVSNINATMKEFGAISGVVTHSDGITSLSGVQVILHDAWVWGQSDGTGNYTVERVRPGTHYLRTSRPFSSSFLDQWYDGVLFVPVGHWWNDPPPEEATPVTVASGMAVTGIDFALHEGARFSGTMTGHGLIPISDGRVRAVNATYGFTRHATTDEAGGYDIAGLYPGDYKVKVEADGFRDEWWDNANHEDDADSFFADVEEHFNIDFDLAPGQSPAYAWVDSSPPGALIYLDYLATTNVTPARVDLGEAASHAQRVARRAVSVKMDGYPYPAPVDLFPIEAETVELAFDLDGIVQTGSVEVVTTPEGATVYVDYADIPAGVTPITVGNLEAESGIHRLFIQMEGYLQPAPIDVLVEADTTTSVDISLASFAEPALAANIISYPPGAGVYLDYLITTNVTPVRMDHLDAAQYAGSGWWSASHTLLLTRDGYLRPLPRYLDFDDPEDQQIIVHLIPDEAYWQAFPDPEQAQFEDWANTYGGTNVIGGANDDPFGKGLSNKEQMLAGLDPTDPDSRFEFHEWVPPSEEGIRIEWPSVQGKRYLVQYTEDLQSSVWHNLTSIITATDTVTWVIDGSSLADVGRYYRVVVIP